MPTEILPVFPQLEIRWLESQSEIQQLKPRASSPQTEKRGARVVLL